MAEPVRAIDFSRSFCYYVPRGHTIWVRIQVECRCEVFDRLAGRSEEYALSVRTQTGLRTEPPSDALDPGYDFWMIFSQRHVFIRRTHTSAYNRNPTRVPVSDFVATGWRFQPCPATPLGSAAEVLAALQAWRPVVARTEFTSVDGARGYAIEYPVTWADGDAERNAFRVETGPVVLLDPERVRVGESPEFDDFRWAYLDYHSIDRVRCFLERPTSILSGATYEPAGTSRRHPALTAEQVGQIEARLYEGWEPPIPVDDLRHLLQTDHYSAVAHLPAATTLFALDVPGADEA
jgi:hypothetical protein